MADDEFDLIDEAPAFPPKSALAAAFELNRSDSRFVVFFGAAAVFWLVLTAERTLPDGPHALGEIAATLPDFGVYLTCVVVLCLVCATVGAAYMALYWPVRVQRNRQRRDLSKYEASRIAQDAGTIVILPLAGLFLLAMWIYYRFFA